MFQTLRLLALRKTNFLEYSFADATISSDMTIYMQICFPKNLNIKVLRLKTYYFIFKLNARYKPKNSARRE